jgi:hypothetical protein
LPPLHITKIIPYVFRIMCRTRRAGDGWCGPFPDGRQRWREDAIEQLLAIEDADVLFVAGCEENQVRFHPRFDVIILPSAPAEVLVERLASRMGNPYGKAPGELQRVVDDPQAVEPLLRKAADHEIRTTMSLSDVVTMVLRLTGVRRHGQDTRQPPAR